MRLSAALVNSRHELECYRAYNGAYVEAAFFLSCANLRKIHVNSVHTCITLTCYYASN